MGKMEYRIERGDIMPKGAINFDSGSTILVSPINFQGLPKYDGCCIYIQNSAKKEYFLCAETPAAARAWVSTLQATQVVLKVHKEAVNALGGSGLSNFGMVGAVVTAANAIAREASKEIAASMQVQSKSELSQGSEGSMDDLSIMKETLRVKDEELHQMAKEIRARDATIKELAERLSEAAEAAQAAATAAHIMDNERKTARTEVARLRGELEEKLQLNALELKTVEEKLLLAGRARDEAVLEGHNWRTELAKVREHAVIMEATLLCAEENARLAAVDVEAKVNAHLDAEATALAAKEAFEKEAHLVHGLLGRDLEGFLITPRRKEENGELVNSPKIHLPNFEDTSLISQSEVLSSSQKFEGFD